MKNINKVNYANAKSHTHLQFAKASRTSQKLQKSTTLPTLQTEREK